MSKSLCLSGLVLALSLGVTDAHGQFLVDLTADVTQVGDVYTYTYTASNQFLSTVGMNFLLISVENDAVISDVTGPAGWTSGYDPAELNFQVFSIAGDGFTVDDESFDIAPGQSGTFTMKSTWAPGLQGYNIAKLLPPDFDFGGFIENEILAPTTRPDSGLACDFDKDGGCGVTDIDLLGTAIVSGENETSFDLTGDDLVNTEDLNAFLTNPSVNKLNGDLDFDGTVTFADFLVIANNFGKDGIFRWSEGDLVPNERVEFADFLVFSSSFGKTTNPTAAAVPEPAAETLVLLGLPCLLGIRRKGNKSQKNV